MSEEQNIIDPTEPLSIEITRSYCTHCGLNHWHACIQTDRVRLILKSAERTHAGAEFEVGQMLSGISAGLFETYANRWTAENLKPNEANKDTDHE